MRPRLIFLLAVLCACHLAHAQSADKAYRHIRDDGTEITFQASKSPSDEQRERYSLLVLDAKTWHAADEQSRQEAILEYFVQNTNIWQLNHQYVALTEALEWCDRMVEGDDSAWVVLRRFRSYWVARAAGRTGVATDWPQG